MKAKADGFNEDDLNLIKLAPEYAGEGKARQLLESFRWPDGPVCPHCHNTGEKSISPLVARAGSKSPVRKGVYFCGACRKQFTVTVGTVWEGSHIPIGKWLMAMFIICSGKKSVSASRLHRTLKITYKSAWFMAHRIRFAMAGDAQSLPRGDPGISANGLSFEDASRRMLGTPRRRHQKR